MRTDCVLPEGREGRLALPAAVLETDRLILRPYTEDDFDAVHSYASNPANVTYMVWGPNSAEDTLAFLRLTIEKNARAPRTDFDFAVVTKDGAQFIGGCGIYLNAERYEGTLGWILRMDNWKRGLGTELGARLLRFGFEELGLHRVRATCNTENYGSRRVMERIGMRREACFVQARFGRVGENNTWYDEYHYGILGREWREQHGIAM